MFNSRNNLKDGPTPRSDSSKERLAVHLKIITGANIGIHVFDFIGEVPRDHLFTGEKCTETPSPI